MNVFSVLIIGGDGLIGKQLGKTMVANGIKTYSTSRHPSNLNADIYYLNLSDATAETTELPSASTVIFCAGISGYELCSSVPALAAQVNVVNTLKLATRFLQNKCHVIFISSAAAIGGSESTQEDATCSPLTFYGALKYATELGLAAEARKYGAPLSIVRLTKVVVWGVSFLDVWLSDAIKGLPIQAYSNRLLSPISIEYVCDALLKIVINQSNGIFHLSGDRTISYYEFAKKLVEIAILPNTLIHSVNCSKEDFRDGYLDAPILSLTEISRRAGIHSECIDDMLLTLKQRMDKND